MTTPLQKDAIKFLKVLLGPCDEGPGEHVWRKCKRCLAMNEVENSGSLAQKFINEAIKALEGKGGGK